jgi:hypothetical protein
MIGFVTVERFFIVPSPGYLARVSGARALRSRHEQMTLATPLFRLILKSVETSAYCLGNQTLPFIVSAPLSSTCARFIQKIGSVD